MITQVFLDMLRDLLHGVIVSLPPLPPELSTAIGQMESSAGSLGASIARTGEIIPWGTLGTIASIWLALVGFWAVVLVVRFVLWAFGR